MKFNEKSNEYLSPTEKAIICDNNLTLSLLSSRYTQARHRALTRQGEIMPRNQFYRVLMNLILEKSVVYSLTPLDTLQSCDIHSINFQSYLMFDLLLKAEHKKLHTLHRLRKAQLILENDEQHCRHCKELKPLSEFYPDKRKLIKVEGTCKKCRLLALKKKRAFDEERLAA